MGYVTKSIPVYCCSYLCEWHLKHLKVLKKNLTTERCPSGRGQHCGSRYLLPPAVLPGDPLLPVAGVAQPVAAGKLAAVPLGMPPLRAHQRQEVQRAQVHLQVLGAAGIDGAGRAPGTVTLPCAQPDGGGSQEGDRGQQQQMCSHPPLPSGFYKCLSSECFAETGAAAMLIMNV